MDVEKELEESYVTLLQTVLLLPPSQAKSLVGEMLRQVKEESLREGTSNLPRNFGQVLLQKEATDKDTQLMLGKRRREGVKDDDIRWWWDMGDLERRMMQKVDDYFKSALYIKCRGDDGLNEEEAAEHVRKFQAIYGDPDDTSHTSGDDRPLPDELKDRVNKYIERRSQSDPEKCKADIEKSSTFNALVRVEIRRGNL